MGREVSVRAAMDASEPSINKWFADKPLAQASIRNAVGLSYYYSGGYPAAICRHDRTLALRREHLGHEAEPTHSSMMNLGAAYMAAGNVNAALPLFEETMQIDEVRLKPDDPAKLVSMHNLAMAYRKAGKTEEALRLGERSLSIRMAALGLTNVYGADLKSALGRIVTAASVSNTSIESREKGKKLREAIVAQVDSMHNLAGIYSSAGCTNKTIELLEQVLQLREAILPPDHPDALRNLTNLGATYSEFGMATNGIPLLERGLTLQKRVLVPDHPHTTLTMDNLATAYLLTTSHYVDVEMVLRDLLREQSKSLPSDDQELPGTRSRLGSFLLWQGKPDQAEEYLRDALTVLEKAQPGATSTFQIQSVLGCAFFEQKKYPDAERLILRSYDGLLKRHAEKPSRSVARELKTAGERIVPLYESWGKPALAAEWREKLR
jgi:tetratricopeptide (TPR) repeat protein